MKLTVNCKFSIGALDPNSPQALKSLRKSEKKCRTEINFPLSERVRNWKLKHDGPTKSSPCLVINVETVIKIAQMLLVIEKVTIINNLTNQKRNKKWNMPKRLLWCSWTNFMAWSIFKKTPLLHSKNQQGSNDLKQTDDTFGMKVLRIISWHQK